MPLETRQHQIERETCNLKRFQFRADAVCHLIVNTDLPWPDVSIRIEGLRRDAERLFPLKMDLFDLIYISRFERLWEQWRNHGD